MYARTSVHHYDTRRHTIIDLPTYLPTYHPYSHNSSSSSSSGAVGGYLSCDGLDTASEKDLIDMCAGRGLATKGSVDDLRKRYR